MTLVFNEQFKHRVMGGIVVLSLIIIFLPAFMKQSNQRFDESMNQSFRLPSKPALPQVAIIDKKKMFKAVKVATVTIPSMEQVQTHIAKAVPLSTSPAPEQSTQVVTATPVKRQVSEDSISEHISLNAKSDDYFTIQLATFSQQANAQALVSSLREQGFQALSQVINREDGAMYQVIVGQLKQRDQAVDLQRKLVNNTQLNGLIIKTKVS